MHKFKVWVLSILVLFAMTSMALASSPMVMVLEALKDKTKKTGTLDLYDPKIDAVRNLRMLESKDVQKEGINYRSNIKYRDINTGDIVVVSVLVEDNGGKGTVTQADIVSVKKLEKKSDEKREFSDQEIQAFMREYVDEKSKFTGALMLYDEDNEVMRNLKLNSIKEEIRRFGSVFISTAEFEDIDSNDTLDIDMTVRNKKGDLELKSLKIRKVHKASK